MTAAGIAAAGGAASPPKTAVIVVAPHGPTRLFAAQAAARAAAAHGERVTVLLHGGTYKLRGPLELRRQDSGRPGAPVTYRNYPGEHPLLSGGRRITGWHRLHDGTWVAGAPGLRTRELYVDGRRATRARGAFPAGATETATGYDLPEGTRVPWGAGAELVYRTKWTQHRGRVAAVNGRQIRMAQPFWANAHLFASARVAGPPAWVENDRSLLDAPGEWYLGRAAGTIAYRPRPGQDMHTAEVVAPVLTHLLTLHGSPTRPVHDIRISGIGLAYAGWRAPDAPDGVVAVQADFRLVGHNSRFVDPSDRWIKQPAALTVHGARRITLDHLRLEHVAAGGIDIADSSRYVTVRRSALNDIGGNGLMVGGIDDHHPQPPAKPVADVAITDSTITRAGAEYEGGVGIWAGYPQRVTIAHNSLHDLSYSAISLGWGWGARDWPNNPTTARDNRIVGNEIARPMQTLNDGGGIYIVGSQPGLLVAANVVHGDHAPYGALYLDAGTRHARVEQNVVYDSGDWIVFPQSGNTIAGNYWDVDPHIPGNTLIAGPADAPAVITGAAGPRPEG